MIINKIIKNKRYILPSIIILLTYIVVLYLPKTAINTNSNSKNLPTVKETSPLYSNLTEKLQGEKTYLEVATALVKHLELTRDPFSSSKSDSQTYSKKSEGSASGSSARSSGKLKLEGVWDSDDQKVAFISGTMVKVKDYINGYTVSKISDREVTLLGHGGVLVLKIEG